MRTLKPGEQPFRGKTTKDDLIKYLKIAKIIRVDYEEGYADIEWIEGAKAIRSYVYLPAAYSSQRGCIRGMPEIGSLVVCGWYRGQTHTWEDPVILSYMDMNLDILNNYSLLRSNKTANELKQITTIREKIGYDVTRGKRRKIYPGELQIESSQGAELYVDEDIYLSNSKLNEIEIRSADQSIRISTNQIYSITQAARTWQGMITRESTSNFIYQPTVLPNGKKIQIVTDTHQPIHMGGNAYTENRTELFEKSDGILKVSEINSGVDVSDQTPFITQVTGTLVGNDKKDGSKYGKVLKPQVFGSATSVDRVTDYLEATPDEYDTLASCYSLQFNKTGAQIDVDKEGHLFTFFPASSGRQALGAGRSWEALFDGSVKLVIGKESINNNSLILDTMGSIKATLGFDKDGRSSFITTQKGMRTLIQAPATDGFAYYMSAKGNHQTDVIGNYGVNVNGNYNIVVTGKITEQIQGVKEENYVNDKNNLYGGYKKSIVMKGIKDTIGYNRAVTIAGAIETGMGIITPSTIDTPTQYSDTLDLTLGGQKITTLSGHLLQTVILGNIKRIIIAGDSADPDVGGDSGFLDKITTGNHVITVDVGSIKRKITIGDYKLDIATGSIVKTIVSGSDKTNITTGDIIQEVVTGNIKRTVTASGDIKDTTAVQGNITHNAATGNITDTISIQGDRTVTLTLGDFKVLITTSGKISLMTSLGNVEMTAATGEVNITGSLAVNIQSGVKIVNQAPLVNLGPAPVQGGVVTGLPLPSTLCFITGSPHLCSATVTASL